MNYIKFLLILSFVVFFCSSKSKDSNYKFSDYVRQFKKNYQGVQYAQREKTFNQNYKLLLQFEQEANGTCHYEVNDKIDLTEQERQGLLGYTISKDKPFKTLPPKLRGQLGFTYPESLDYRDLNDVTPVKDQGSCGSCWAFSTIAVYESLLAMQTGNHYDLSQQFVLECETTSFGCGGGYPEEAFILIESNGVPTEQQYEYTQDDDSEGSQMCLQTDLTKLSLTIDSISHYGFMSDSQLKQLLYDHGPVSVGVYANTAFDWYSSGVFTGCPSYSSSFINHAVQLIGYTDEGDWIIKNSWGTDWGMNGYMVISKNNNCGLTTYVDALEADWTNYHDDQEEEQQQQEQQEDQDDIGQFLNYKVHMTDSYGDGWNGLIIGVRQGTNWTSTFGSGFNSGSSYGPVTIQVKNNVQANLMVVQYGSYSSQVGFQIYDQSGSKIYIHCAGQSFSSNIIFTTWCPGDACQTSQMFNLTITMTDTYGDGWNGNSFYIKQGSTSSDSFGESFTSGHQAGPVIIEVVKGIQAEVLVNTIGTWRLQVGFLIKDSEGNTIFNRSQPSMFSADSIIGTFCPGCTNPAHVRTAIMTSQQKQKFDRLSDIDSSSKQPDKLDDKQRVQVVFKQTQINSLIIAVSILGTLTVIFVTISIIFFILWLRGSNSKESTISAISNDGVSTGYEDLSNHKISQILIKKKRNRKQSTDTIDYLHEKTDSGINHVQKIQQHPQE